MNNPFITTVMNKELIEKYIEAYNSKNVPGMIALLEDDVLFENVSNASEGITTHTKVEFERLAVQSLAYFSERKQTIRFITESQNSIAIEIDYQATFAADFPDPTKAGQQLNLRGVSVFEIKEGKITRISDYS
ncbi:steroid delta-isomerase-like uncharacterized protein [Siphonobacter sp. BAB-5404]|nr:steroid delta-isomerase-like uncharacterized protein [Siphonobacter sp. SORGH_AS_0500]